MEGNRELARKNSLVTSKLHILQDTLHRMLRKGQEGERKRDKWGKRKRKEGRGGEGRKRKRRKGTIYMFV